MPKSTPPNKKRYSIMYGRRTAKQKAASIENLKKARAALKRLGKSNRGRVWVKKKKKNMFGRPANRYAKGSYKR